MTNFATRNILESDKYYWHRYTDVYTPAFSCLGSVGNIVEFGIFHGASVRWLRECFAGANILGLDLLATQSDWPTDDRITYKKVDQGDRVAVRAALSGVDQVDLIIEDGSHVPQHQASCLAEAFPRLRPGGLYVLEDINTSHPLQSDFARHSVIGGRRRPNALNVLMGIQHLKDRGAALGPDQAAALSDPSFFSIADVGMLFEDIDRVDIYKRTKLPLRCYACGGSAFDYTEWRCSCGVGLNGPADSMSALIWKAARRRAA